MALNSKAKRMAAAGAGRPYMRATLAASVNADQRSSIGLSYPVTTFTSILTSFPKIAAWLTAKTEFEGTINDKMRQFLDSKGHSSGTINDDFYYYLEANSWDGKQINDKIKQATDTGWLWQQ